MYYRRRSWPTREAARMAVLTYIEVTYNWRRPHATIDYRFPAQVMREFFDRTAEKARELDKEEKKAA